jgi:hypothetical protein
MVGVDPAASATQAKVSGILARFSIAFLLIPSVDANAIVGSHIRSTPKPISSLRFGTRTMQCFRARGQCLQRAKSHARSAEPLRAQEADFPLATARSF